MIKTISTERLYKILEYAIADRDDGVDISEVLDIGVK
jgi:hypothetical protein